MRTSLVILGLATAIVLPAGCGGDDEPDRVAANSTVTDADAGQSAATGADTAPSDTDADSSASAEAPKPSLPGQRGKVGLVVQEMYAALARKDGDTACALQTKGLQARFMRSEIASNRDYKGKTCGEIRVAIVSEYTPEALKTFEHIVVKDVTIKGSRATVVHVVPGAPGTTTSVPMKLVSGSWQVDG